MADRDDRELLIEATASAHRARDAVSGAPRAHPGWHDLDDAGRREAFELAVELRALEAATDPDGLSAAGRAVLTRIRRR